MYTPVSSSLFGLVTLVALAAAGPTPRAQTLYFAVSGFSFSNTTISSRYQFNVSFPQDVVISPASGADPTFVIPGFTTPVPCTGTYFYSPSENETITLINACGYVEGDRSNPKVVTSKLDVVKGVLYLTYSYNATAEDLGVFVWNATQTGLSPVTPEALEGFNTPASGPGVSN